MLALKPPTRTFPFRKAKTKESHRSSGRVARMKRAHTAQRSSATQLVARQSAPANVRSASASDRPKTKKKLLSPVLCRGGGRKPALGQAMGVGRLVSCRRALTPPTGSELPVSTPLWLRLHEGRQTPPCLAVEKLIWRACFLPDGRQGAWEGCGGSRHRIKCKED